MTDRECFERIRARYLKTCVRRTEFRQDMLKRYGEMNPPDAWLRKGELDRSESIERAMSKAGDAMFELLDVIGGRNFQAGCPWWWVMEELTFEDATTRGVMSVAPPPSYGQTWRDVATFVAARE